jgi:hypothetical protein
MAAASVYYLRLTKCSYDDKSKGCLIRTNHVTFLYGDASERKRGVDATSPSCVPAFSSSSSNPTYIISYNVVHLHDVAFDPSGSIHRFKRLHDGSASSGFFLCRWQVHKHHSEHISARGLQELTDRTGNITAQYKIGHIYVERLTPPIVHQQYPFVFIVGAGQNGTNLLKTPDVRPGWASFCLDQGYIVYLSDQASHGRSPWNLLVSSMMTTSTASV